jgi:hypothetical protein
MARGVVFGIVMSGSDPVSGARVGLSALRGADSNGTLIQYSVPPEKIEAGNWFHKISFTSETRATNDAGIFILPFAWDQTSPDNWGRIAGTDVLTLKVIAFKPDSTAYATAEGVAYKVPDGIQLMAEIKSGKALLESSNKDILKDLKQQYKDAIKGDEVKPIPYTFLSTDQIAIVGIARTISF